MDIELVHLLGDFAARGRLAVDAVRGTLRRRTEVPADDEVLFANLALELNVYVTVGGTDLDERVELRGTAKDLDKDTVKTRREWTGDRVR